MANKLLKFHIQRYRSLLDLTIDLTKPVPYIICGENNIGKTNVLRALNAFFNHVDSPSLFNPQEDIPHHIFFGSQGAGAKTELTGTFEIAGQIKELYLRLWNKGSITYKIDGKKVEVSDAERILSEFRYFFVESYNIDVPGLIGEILASDGLLPLDKKRSKQSKSLEKLYDFIDTSRNALVDIENDINEIFARLTDFDGILKDKKITINFGEFNRLRDVIKLMTNITLFDGNNHGIAAKGSGAQRAVFLTLMQFISKNTKKSIIWGIDEPEVFLQPLLQKKVASLITDIVVREKQPVILTTHSPNFIDLRNLSNTHLFKGEVSERSYARKPGEIFYEVNTRPISTTSDSEKIQLIKKHLGISNNDGWAVVNLNIVVEGEEDKKYLEKLLMCLNLPIPNIVFSGGASKIGGNLQFFNLFAKDLAFKPEFRCVFDNDQEGRDQKSKVKPGSCPNIIINMIRLPRYDGVDDPSANSGDWEIEDLIPPDIFIDCVNKIIKSEGYSPITQAQKTNRSLPGHIGKQILKYIEECCTQNNSAKTPLLLDNEGRKKQICLKFCADIDTVELASKLTRHHSDFLQKLL